VEAKINWRNSTSCRALLLLFAFVALSAGAQAQTAQWIKQQGIGGMSNGVSSDAAGNVYATGTISNPGLFDNITIPCHASDVFVTKYDANGTLRWAKVGGGELLDQANDIATDADGNSYVAGAIQTNGLYPTVSFDNITLTGNGDYDWFIARYDANGNVVWAKNAGSPQGDIAQGVALDSIGNVYVCGLFSGTMTVDGVTVTSSGLFDVFLAKYDANGILLWLKRAGGTGSDIAHRVTTDVSGNVAIVGEFQNTASFDSHSVTSAGLGNAFIAKYDAAGNNLWVRGGGSTTSFATDPARSIGVDGASNFYVTGDYTGPANFDGLSVSNAGHRDVFVAKYNTNGVIQWLHHAGGPSAEEGHSIGVDQSGNSWVSGFLGSGPGVVFDSISLPPRGNEYIFLAKYDPAGVVQYVKQYAAGRGQDINVLNNGCLYFGGGASKAQAGNEFDNISLVYVDRGGFAGEFCEPVAPLALSIVSRKVQGSAIFDIDLPLSGTAGVECRSGGTSGDHQVCVTFRSPVTVTNASVTTGAGSVSCYFINGSQVIVNLTSVANAQMIVITLSGVSDGTNTSNISVPMGVLLGDTTGNGMVNASDIGQIKGQSGAAVTLANFRSDVTANGSISASDVALAKSYSGVSLP
jgi:hypothetical protein